MSTAFRIVQDRIGSMDLFEFHGTIDAQAEALLSELPGKVRRTAVALDFSRTVRVNSMGIALLLRCLKTLKEGRKAEVFLRGLNQTNSLLFKMTGIFLLASPMNVSSEKEKNDEAAVPGYQAA